MIVYMLFVGANPLASDNIIIHQLKNKQTNCRFVTRIFSMVTGENENTILLFHQPKWNIGII